MVHEFVILKEVVWLQCALYRTIHVQHYILQLLEAN